MCTCPSLQSVLWNNGADGAGSHQEASALLRSLNLPQHTGMSAEPNPPSFCTLRRCFCDHLCLCARGNCDPLGEVGLFVAMGLKVKSPTASTALQRPAASGSAHLRCCCVSPPLGGDLQPHTQPSAFCCTSGAPLGVRCKE